MATLRVVIILATFGLVSQARAKSKCARAIDKIDALDNKVATLVESMSQMGKELTMVKDQLRDFNENKDRGESEKSSCSPEWAAFGTSCYRLVDSRLSWNEAVKNCNKLGGYLAEVDSEAEDIFLFGLFYISGKKGNGPWIGGSDTGTEGQWVWKNSGNPITYTNWKSSEPNGGTSENCIHYDFFTDRGWNDNSCENENLMSICEM